MRQRRMCLRQGVRRGGDAVAPAPGAVAGTGHQRDHVRNAAGSLTQRRSGAAVGQPGQARRCAALCIEPGGGRCRSQGTSGAGQGSVVDARRRGGRGGRHQSGNRRIRRCRRWRAWTCRRREFPSNLSCLRLPWPSRRGEQALSSAWACSRNDVHEGLAVMVASVATWAFGSGWPGLPIAAVLPCLFLRSAWRARATHGRSCHARPPRAKYLHAKGNAGIMHGSLRPARRVCGRKCDSGSGLQRFLPASHGAHAPGPLLPRLWEAT